MSFIPDAYCEGSSCGDIFALREAQMWRQGSWAAALHAASCWRGCSRGWSRSAGETKGGGGCGTG